MEPEIRQELIKLIKTYFKAELDKKYLEKAKAIKTLVESATQITFRLGNLNYFIDTTIDLLDEKIYSIFIFGLNDYKSEAYSKIWLSITTKKSYKEFLNEVLYELENGGDE